jgi:hypothetical protein
LLKEKDHNSRKYSYLEGAFPPDGRHTDFPVITAFSLHIILPHLV